MSANARPAAHTPGPWRVDDPAYAVVVGPDDKDICITESGGAHEPAEDAANARLIAVAPEMADLLKDTYVFFLGRAAKNFVERDIKERIGDLLARGVAQ